jgi:hypothetical protein
LRRLLAKVVVEAGNGEAALALRKELNSRHGILAIRYAMVERPRRRPTSRQTRASDKDQLPFLSSRRRFLSRRHGNGRKGYLLKNSVTGEIVTSSDGL